MHGVSSALKPFLWLAVLAFAVGFFGVLAVSRPARAVASMEAQPALASGPASADWNLPKHI